MIASPPPSFPLPLPSAPLPPSPCLYVSTPLPVFTSLSLPPSLPPPPPPSPLPTWKAMPEMKSCQYRYLCTRGIVLNMHKS